VFLRAAQLGDLDELVAVQEEGAVTALAHIFPQESYPFPRAEVRDRWAREIADPAISAYVSTDAARGVTGFAATRGDELLHFGTAVATWGTGLAQQLHDAVLQELRRTGPGDADRIWLRVFEENRRARRFYEKLGWTLDGRRTRTSFPPHPVLLRYERTLARSVTGPSS
jgi:RimJ/RimL family protein N-acetyltransferase